MTNENVESLDELKKVVNANLERANSIYLSNLMVVVNAELELAATYLVAEELTHAAIHYQAAADNLKEAASLKVIEKFKRLRVKRQLEDV